MPDTTGSVCGTLEQGDAQSRKTGSAGTCVSEALPNSSLNDARKDLEQGDVQGTSRGQPMAGGKRASAWQNIAQYEGTGTPRLAMVEVGERKLAPRHVLFSGEEPMRVPAMTETEMDLNLPTELLMEQGPFLIQPLPHKQGGEGQTVVASSLSVNQEGKVRIRVINPHNRSIILPGITPLAYVESDYEHVEAQGGDPGPQARGAAPDLRAEMPRREAAQRAPRRRRADECARRPRGPGVLGGAHGHVRLADQGHARQGDGGRRGRRARARVAPAVGRGLEPVFSAEGAGLGRPRFANRGRVVLAIRRRRPQIPPAGYVC